MKEKVLIVEDQFVEADFLRLMLTNAGYIVCSIARSVTEAQKIIKKEKPKLVLLDIFLKGKLTGIDLAQQLRDDNIAFIYLSANSNEDILRQAKVTEPYGFLVKPFREKDLLIALEIAQYRQEHGIESKLRKVETLEKHITQIINETGNWEQKVLSIGKAIQPYINFDYLAAGFNQIDELSCNTISFLRVAFDEYQTIGVKELELITKLTLPDLVKLSEKSHSEDISTFYNGEDFKMVVAKHGFKGLIASTFNMKSHLSLPLHLSNGNLFNFCFYSRRSDAYKPENLELLRHLEFSWARSIEKMLAAISPETEADTQTLSKDIDPQNFMGIIGKSHLLLNVFDNITQVAPLDTSVLILGESGTGKEKIAECIHKLSPQNGNPFIKVNCAALPPTLIESELFGHEKGAFTGATQTRIGKFEQANKGTIFLDEIGELPLESQVKLLRVLQEKEIERVGSRVIKKISVRIIAATNRNLEKEVAEGRFRLDLYYRLNVFPIYLPPLRERKEDIPELTSHFINYYNRKAGKKVIGISDKVLKKFENYDWPGNIRELEHLIERSVLLAKSRTIEDIKLPDNQIENTSLKENTYIKSIEENERDHILAVLKKCNWKIWGQGGAAEVFNLPPTTLKSKMIKLGIKKEYIE